MKASRVSRKLTPKRVEKGKKNIHGGNSGITIVKPKFQVSLFILGKNGEDV